MNCSYIYQNKLNVRKWARTRASMNMTPIRHNKQTNTQIEGSFKVCEQLPCTSLGKLCSIFCKLMQSYETQYNNIIHKQEPCPVSKILQKNLKFLFDLHVRRRSERKCTVLSLTDNRTDEEHIKVFEQLPPTSLVKLCQHFVH